MAFSHLSTDWFYCHPSLSSFTVAWYFVARGDDLRSYVASGFGSFVVPPGQDGPDEPDDGFTAGKMPTTSARRRISFLRRCGLLAQIRRQISEGRR